MGLDGPSDLELLAEPTRQSPVAIGQAILGNIRGIGIVNVVVGLGVVLTQSLPGWVLAVAPFVGLLIIAAGVATWWRFTFRVTDETLVVTRGVVSRNTLVIPFAKVQSVTIEENLVERLFGLVSASVDTAGSDETEFSISGISREQAEALRRLTTEAWSTVSPASEEDTGPLSDLAAMAPPTVVLAKRTPRQLMAIGMLGNPLGGLAIMGALALFADETLGRVGIELPEIGDQTVSTSKWLLVAGAAVLIGILFLSWFAVGLRTVVTDWDLRLATGKDGIGIDAGLLKRRSRSSHLNKVQSVEANHGPLLRLVGFCKLNLAVIGAGNLVIAGVTSDELGRVRHAVGIPFPSPLTRTVSPHLIFHRVRLAAYLAVPAAIVAAFFDWRFAPLWLLFPILTWIKAYLFHRSFRWELADETISRRGGNLMVQEFGMNTDKVQTVRLDQNFYQRKRDLSTISVSNAESVVSIPMLPLPEARALRDLLLA